MEITVKTKAWRSTRDIMPPEGPESAEAIGRLIYSNMNLSAVGGFVEVGTASVTVKLYPPTKEGSSQ